MQILQQGERTPQQMAHALSILLFGITALLVVIAFVGYKIQALYLDDGYGTGLSCALIGCILIWAIILCYLMKLPLKCYGFIKANKKAIIESIIYSLIFCAAVLVFKYYLINHVSALSKYPMIMIIHGKPTVSSETLWWYLLFYCIFAPFQCFYFHGAIQGPMMDLTNTKAKAFMVVLLVSLIFSAVHIAFSIAFAILVFFVGLVWTILYYRHRCLTSISISHIIIGGLLMFVAGIGPFLDAINLLLDKL